MTKKIAQESWYLAAISFTMRAMSLIIVVGRGHGGTRAISRTLVESGVFMGGELNESYDLIPPEEFYEACRIVGAKVTHLGATNWDFSRLLDMPIPDEFDRLVRSYASSVFASDSPLRGWKLPETTLALPWIVRMFPDAYYIYWVRDPRDSIIGKHGTDDLKRFGVSYDATENVRYMRAISWKYQREIVAATPQPARWHRVKFEDFVLDQDRTLGRLETFLGFELARIPVRTESVGRWKEDGEEHDFDIFHDDLIELEYIDANNTNLAERKIEE